MRHAYDVLQEDYLLGIGANGGDDEAIQFQDRRLDVVKKLQVGVARPEVVKRQAAELIAQFQKRGDAAFDFAELLTFGDFQRKVGIGEIIAITQGRQHHTELGARHDVTAIKVDEKLEGLMALDAHKLIESLGD